MAQPITLTSLLVFLGSSVVNGVVGNRSYATFKRTWDTFVQNLDLYVPRTNQQLQLTAYRSYLQATLQSCATFLDQRNIRVDAWFRFGALPERMANPLRGLLGTAPEGVFTAAAHQWIEQVSRELLKRLGQLDEDSLATADYKNEEFDLVASEIELLVRPRDSQHREKAIRQSLTKRVLNDLEAQFGEPPQEFVTVVNEMWFEYLCANFQFYLNDRPEVANAFESNLLAKLVTRAQWQDQFVKFGGESLRRIEASQAWLTKKQNEGFQRLESSVNLLLPLLSIAQDEPARRELLAAFIQTESRRVIDAVTEHVEAASQSVVVRITEVLDERVRNYPGPGEPEPLIHTLPIDQEIEGREKECDAILSEMAKGQHKVLALAAPGGFGKTALISKLVRKIWNGQSFNRSVKLGPKERIEPNVGKLLHVDCRREVSMSALFSNAGRLSGREREFLDVYNDDSTLAEKLQRIFTRLSHGTHARTWFVFDNFESIFDDQGKIINPDLRCFFSEVFVGGHLVHVLISGRDVPKFSPREPVVELKAVGESLFEGLPAADCVAYLRKQGAADGLNRASSEIDALLKKFASRVHRIPFALVWAVGYLTETSYTLEDLLLKSDLFADFDNEQQTDAERYENKGLKRLHYEQLRNQSAESLSVLRLLALFGRPIVKGALAHLLSEPELSKTLVHLEESKLVTHKKSADQRALFLNDPLAVDLYGLHPIICENKFFAELPAGESFYEAALDELEERGLSAMRINRFGYALELFGCAELLCEHLIYKLNRVDLLDNYASILMNSGPALLFLARLPEAVFSCDKAIKILEALQTEKDKEQIPYYLATAHRIKAEVLTNWKRLPDAVTESENAIAILERLVREEAQSELAGDLGLAHVSRGNALQGLLRSAEAVTEYQRATALLECRLGQEWGEVAAALATAYMNNAAALTHLTRLPEAIAESDKAIHILEFLVDEGKKHFYFQLATAYLNKSNALLALDQFAEAVVEYDRAIAILERVINIEKQVSLVENVAIACLNKAVALRKLKRLGEAKSEIDKATSILERLVNVEFKTHLTRELASAYQSRGTILQALLKFDSALEESDKAVSLYEHLVNVQGQVHLTEELANSLAKRGRALMGLKRFSDAWQAYEDSAQIFRKLAGQGGQDNVRADLALSRINQGMALQELAEPSEAVIAYDSAIDMLGPLVNEENQTDRANDLAVALMNKAMCLQALSNLPDAIANYESATSVLERFEGVDQRTPLHNGVARAYHNMGQAFARLHNWDRSLTCFDRVVQLEGQKSQNAGNNQSGAEMRKAVLCRFAILLELQRWSLAAPDLLQLLRWRDASQEAEPEFALAISTIRLIKEDDQKHLYDELGDASHTITSLVSAEVSERAVHEEPTSSSGKTKPRSKRSR